MLNVAVPLLPDILERKEILISLAHPIFSNFRDRLLDLLQIIRLCPLSNFVNFLLIS